MVLGIKEETFSLNNSIKDSSSSRVVTLVISPFKLAIYVKYPKPSPYDKILPFNETNSLATTLISSGLISISKWFLKIT